MRKRLTQIITGLLAAALLLPVFPVIQTSANTQLGVTEVPAGSNGSAGVLGPTITVSTGGLPTGTNYGLTLNWKRPQASSTADSSANVDGNILTHQALFYDIYYRNASRDLNYPAQPFQRDLPDSAAADGVPRSLTMNLQLDEGSLYAFKVEPYHWHLTDVQEGGQTVRKQVKSAVDKSVPSQESLFLTDIPVTATGAGTTLTVKWKRPSFNGADPFSGYRISYLASLASDKRFPTDGSASTVDALLTDTQRLRYDPATGMYTFTFSAEITEPGARYAVKVEPLVPGQGSALAPLNDTKANDRGYITIGGKRYPITASLNEYRTDVIIQVGLDVVEESKDSIRLFWGGTLGHLPDLIDSGMEVSRIVILSSKDPGFGDRKTEATLYEDYARKIGFILLPKPGEITYYKLLITYTDKVTGDTIEMESTIAIYDPDYNKYTPTKPNIITITDNAPTTPVTMDITWEAFTRKPYKDSEKPLADVITGLLVDLNMTYDIWITDDISLLDDPRLGPMPVFQGLSARDATLQLHEAQDPDNPSQKIWVFTKTAAQYVTADEGGAFSMKSLTGNKIYYVKIIARRTDFNQTASEPAYGSHYVPPTEPLDLRPYIVNKLPLRIKTDENGLEVITDNSIDVTWDARWWEAYDETTGSWYASVGVKGGTVYFGDKIPPDAPRVDMNSSKYTDSRAETILRADLTALGVPNVDRLPLRFLDLADAGYGLHVVEYDYMEAQGGYDAYLKSILDDDAKWTTIRPTGDPLHPEYSVKQSNAPTTGALKPNTAYAILLRPKTAQWAYYPNVVIGTTLSGRGPVDVKPTVPMIQGVGADATTATVRIEYKDSLQYELAWSELMADYPGKGAIIPNATLLTEGKIVDADGKRWLEYTVKDLFPETNYYFWVRAVAQNSTGPAYSEWSNAIMLTTTTLPPPKPPEGLGLISKGHLETLNKEGNLIPPLTQTDFNYMILEWMRNVQDIEDASTGGKAPAGGGSGAATLLTSENIKGFYMAQFSNLVGNRAYYIRAKTVLTVTKNPAGGLLRSYQYVVQLSLNDDFTDPIEFTVPVSATGGAGGGQNAAPTRSITKESAWTTTLKLYTAPYKGEYDGDKNPDLYPLPKDDYEVVYDPNTDTLTYRYRSNGKDAAGNADNGVDQRFISKLIADKAYNVLVDLSAYNGKDVTARGLEIPYSIIKAFDERKITLTIQAGDTTVTLPPGFMNTAEVNALKGFGAGSSVRIQLTKNVGATPALAANEAYAATRQRLTITAVTPSGAYALAYTAQPVTVTQKLNSRTATIDKNAGSYRLASGAWERQKEAYDQVAGALSFKTTTPGVYTAITRNAPAAQTQNDAARDAMAAVGSALNFRDLPSFNPAANIPANDLGKIILAVSKNAKEVYVKTPLTDADRDALAKAGLLVTGGASVSREEAIAALVRLYEVKTKRKVEPYTSLSATPYKDIAQAQEKYRAALLKAGDLGFFASPTAASPKAALTYGDAVQMLDMILADAGVY